jgi:hypothetical protein
MDVGTINMEGDVPVTGKKLIVMTLESRNLFLLLIKISMELKKSNIWQADQETPIIQAISNMEYQ